jgi:hypothetical protein
VARSELSIFATSDSAEGFQLFPMPRQEVLHMTVTLPDLSPDAELHKDYPSDTSCVQYQRTANADTPSAIADEIIADDVIIFREPTPPHQNDWYPSIEDIVKFPPKFFNKISSADREVPLQSTYPQYKTGLLEFTTSLEDTTTTQRPSLTTDTIFHLQDKMSVNSSSEQVSTCITKTPDVFMKHRDLSSNKRSWLTE